MSIRRFVIIVSFALVASPIAVNAEVYSFSYTFANDTTMSAFLEGELQPDGDTVLVTAAYIATYEGIDFNDYHDMSDYYVGLASELIPIPGDANGVGKISLSGDELDIVICPRTDCGYGIYMIASPIAALGIGFTPPNNYAFNFEASYLTENWSLTPGELPTVDESQYAGECVRLRETEAGYYVGKEGIRYTATFSVFEATPFLVQPTDQGSYYFYDSDGRYLASGNSGRVLAGFRPTARAEWSLSFNSDFVEVLQLSSIFSGLNLSITPEDRLNQTEETSHRWRLEPATGCIPFPGVPFTVQGEPQPAPNSDDLVVGFVDAHVHVTAFDFLR